MLVDDKRYSHTYPMRNDERISASTQSVYENQRISIARRAKQLSINHISLRSILQRGFRLFAYKMQLNQELKSKSLLSLLCVDFRWVEQIVISDKAHFHLGGSTSISKSVECFAQKSMYPQTPTVWREFWSLFLWKWSRQRRYGD